MRGRIHLHRQQLSSPPLHVAGTYEPWSVGVRVGCFGCEGRQGAAKKGAFEEDGDEDWKEMMGKWTREKCREEVGMVDLLECLEKEAIMGEDIEKHPADYDRRARIFDKSSKVFQALRDGDDEAERQHPPPA
ncbi:hypothetical protein MLD38_011060 [Melastoma candidum]|uniref:Uncharacterized protein n=1 Tax=Melastoma candidum TaxID=119954 RepID=A0ACB9R4W5_9MYRT|nr:hypothetical protein MLD38_011060 [Melastoma candidum]